MRLPRWRFLMWWALAGVLVLLGCGRSGEAPPQTAAAAAPAVPAAAAAEPQFVASGPIVVEHQVDLTAQRDGVVASIARDTGALVHRGDLLATLDDRQLRADRDAALAHQHSIEADLKNWEALAQVAASDAERAQKMWDAQLITKEDLDHARYKVDASRFEVERQREDLKNAQATVRSLELELAKTRIVAPFQGVVARRYIQLGQKVSTNDRLFWVSAVAPLRVKFMLPQQYLPKVKKGTELSLMPEMGGGMSSARVLMVSPVIDPASGMVEVLAEVQSPAGALRPGMTVNIQLAHAQ